MVGLKSIRVSKMGYWKNLEIGSRLILNVKVIASCVLHINIFRNITIKIETRNTYTVKHNDWKYNVVKDTHFYINYFIWIGCWYQHCVDVRFIHTRTHYLFILLYLFSVSDNACLIRLNEVFVWTKCKIERNVIHFCPATDERIHRPQKVYEH